MIGGLQAPSECCSMLPILGDGGAANTFGPDTRPAVAISQAAHTLIVVFLWPSGGALAADRAPIGSLVNTVLYPPTVERSNRCVAQRSTRRARHSTASPRLVLPW